MIEFVPDLSKVESALGEIESGGSGGDAASFKAGNAELEKRNALQAKNLQNMAQVDAANKKTIVTIGDVTKATDKMASAVISNLAKTANTVDVLQKSLDRLKAKGADATVIANVTRALELHKAKLIELEAAEKKETQATISLRSEKRRLQQEIATLIATGQQETQMFRDLVARAGEIDDAMKDAADAISRTGSDTRGLDNALIAARGIAAGFTVATSTAALFGNESEEVQKTLLKVNAAMGILNGLQEIQNILKSEYVLTLAASIKQQIISNAQTLIENGLKSTNVVVTTAATVAQWALNVAMAANPIGLVVAGIILLIGALSAFISWSGKAAQEQEKFNQSLDATKIEAYNAEVEKGLRVQLALLQLKGVKQSQLSKAELTALDQQIANGNQQIANAHALMLAEEEGSDNRKKAYEQYIVLVNQVSDLVDARILKSIDLEKDLQDERIKGLKDAVSNANVALANSKKNSKDELDARIAGVRAAAVAELAEVGISEAKKAEIRATSEREVEDLTKEFNQRARDRAADSAIAIANIRLDHAKKGSEEELNARIAVMNETRKKELQNVELTNAQKRQINSQFDTETAQMRKEFQKKESEKAADDAIAFAQIRVAVAVEGTRSELNARTALLEANMNKELLNTELTELQKLEIRTRFNVESQKLLDAQIALEKEKRLKAAAETAELEQLLQTAQFGILKRAAEDVKLSDTKRFQFAQQLREKELEAIQKQQLYNEFQKNAGLKTAAEYNKEKLKLDEDYANKKAELDNAQAARDKEIRDAVIGATLASVQAVSDAIFEIGAARREAELNEEVSRIEKEKEKALENKNLTEAQKTEIQKRYDKQVAQLKTEAAKKERKAQITQAFINTALAVTNALATAPWPYNIIAAAAAFVAGMAQIAKMNSAPLPQYAKGGRNVPAGYALVGEEGPEIVKLNGGEDIYPNRQSEQILSQWKVAENGRLDMYGAKNSQRGEYIDYEEIGRQVAAQLPEITTVNMTADEHGLSIFLERQHSRTVVRNRRYSTT
jgi:hypothetical protein